MGTFDDLLIKAKDLASAAGSKAQNVAELTKLRLQAAQLRADLDANYLKLGEIIYELQKAGAENKDLIDMCIAELESQNIELDELNAKINEMKNEKVCSECMSANARDALFCSRCGAQLQPAAYQKVEPQDAPEQTSEEQQEQ